MKRGIDFENNIIKLISIRNLINMIIKIKIMKTKFTFVRKKENTER